MTDDSSPFWDDPGDMPADWLDHRPPEEPSADFVDRVHRAVCAERNVAASYDIPPPSANFVERTLSALRESAEFDSELRQTILKHNDVPEPSTDFVDRTLKAVMAARGDTAPQHAAPGKPELSRADSTTGHPTTAPPTRARRTTAGRQSLLAAAALIAAVGLIWLWADSRGERPGENDDTDRDATNPVALVVDFDAPAMRVHRAMGRLAEAAPTGAVVATPDAPRVASSAMPVTLYSPDPILLLAEGGL